MIALPHAFSSILLLALATFLVLAGLRIWKFYVNLVGAFVGLALGMFVASLFGGGVVLTVIIGMLGALVGSYVAWPLQKATVFIAVGAALASVGMALAQIIMPEWVVWAIGAALFILGGWLSLRLLEPLLIVSMAVAAARVSTHALGGSVCPLQGIRAGVEGVRDAVAMLDPLFVLLAVVYALFALFVQRGCADDEDLAPVVRQRRAILRGAAWMGAAFMLLDLTLYYLFHMRPITGFSPFMWPILALLCGLLAAYALPKVEARPMQWLLAVVGGVIIVFGAGFLALLATAIFWSSGPTFEAMKGYGHIIARDAYIYSFESSFIIILRAAFHLLLLPGAMLAIVNRAAPELRKESADDETASR